MGILTKKKTFVFSTVSNLAGDPLEAQNFLLSTLTANALSDNINTYIGESISRSYLNGPGMSQRRFFRWARDNYSIGMPEAILTHTTQITQEDLEPFITVGTGEALSIQGAFVDFADFVYWAEEYILLNSPELYYTDWVADYDDFLNEVVIYYEDGSTDSFTLTGFNKNSRYIITYYYITEDNGTVSDVTGTLNEGITDKSTIDISGFTFVSTTQNTYDITLTTTEDVLIEYSNGDPDETSSSSSDVIESFTEEDDLWQDIETMGTNGDGSGVETQTESLFIFTRPHIVTTTSTETVVTGTGADTVSTTTTTTTQTIETRYSWRIDTQVEAENAVIGSLRMFIYEIGSGNTALDNVVQNNTTSPAEFFPFIPIRLDNESIDQPVHSAIFEEADTAYDKAFGQDTSEIIASVEESEDIDEIDHAFVVWGVPLNTVINEGKDYIFRFFDLLYDLQEVGQSFDDYAQENTTSATAAQNYRTWYLAQDDPNDPLYNTARPSAENGFTTSAGINTLTIRSIDPVVDSYDIRIQWNEILKNTVTGNADVTGGAANVGDVYMDLPDDPDIFTLLGRSGFLDFDDYEITNLFIRKQINESEYEEIHIIGLVHWNYVYENKTVILTPRDAFADVEESGLIIPLHYPTLKEMGLVDSTQLSVTNSYIRFNSAKTVKVVRGVFRVFAVIVSVAINLLVPGLGVFSGGILGSISAGLGLTGVLGGIGILGSLLGSVVSSVLANILVKAVGGLAVKVFGAKIGGIIATAFSLGVGSGLANPAQAALPQWGNMMKADRLLGLALDTTGTAAKNWSTGQGSNLEKELAENALAFKKESDKITKLIQDSGFNSGIIDPLWFTDTDLNTQSEFQIEPTETYLDRKLMTSEDIVNATIDMVENFTDYTLRLPE